MRTRSRRAPLRGFSLIEVATVMLIAAVVTAVALPQVRAVALTREKEATIERAGATLESARDISRRERVCVGVNFDPGACGGGAGALESVVVDCATGIPVGGPVPQVPPPVPINPEIVASVTTGPVPWCCYDITFNPDGSLQPVIGYEGHRELNYWLQTGEVFTQEVYPAIGAVRRTR